METDDRDSIYLKMYFISLSRVVLTIMAVNVNLLLVVNDAPMFMLKT